MVVFVEVGKGGVGAPCVPLEITLSVLLVVRVLGQGRSEPWSVCLVLATMR